MHKEYELRVTREYTTSVFLRFPDDGRDHKTSIGEQVLEQMDIAHEDWEIIEIKQQ